MLRKNKSRGAGILLLAVCLAAAGCKKEETPPQAPSPPKPVQSAQPAKPPVQKQSTSVKNLANKPIQQQTSSVKRILPGETVIDFSGRKDPFKPYAIEPVTPTKAEPAPRAHLLPIQSYDVSKFRLIGIVTGLKENRALVVDPLGKGYVVKVGMLIGNSDGRITRITGTAVEVLEQFRDENGTVRKRSVKITLPPKSKERVR